MLNPILELISDFGTLLVFSIPQIFAARAVKERTTYTYICRHTYADTHMQKKKQQNPEYLLKVLPLENNDHGYSDSSVHSNGIPCFQFACDAMLLRVVALAAGNT